MTANDATLVVIEYGATWPRWLSPLGARNAAVVAQHYEGADDSLLFQVQSRVSRLLAVGWTIQDVVLVLNGRSDPEILRARASLAEELISVLSRAGAPRLLLTADASADARARACASSLAASLECLARPAGVEVALRTGPPTPVSPPAVKALRQALEGNHAARSVQSTRYA